MKALDLVVGGLALARYASSQTEDRKVRRLFEEFAATARRQERLLRRQLTEYGVLQEQTHRALNPRGTPWRSAAVALAGVAVSAAATVVAVRALRGGPDGPVRRATQRTLAAVGIGAG